MVKLTSSVRGELEEFLYVMPTENLQSLGIATFYLTKATSNEPNQCVPATAAVCTALTHYGTRSEIVPATLKVSWSDLVRGSDVPVLQSDGNTNAHFVVITENDEMVDPTALQFADLTERRGRIGILPITGSGQGLWQKIQELKKTSDKGNVPVVISVGSNDSQAIYNLQSPEDSIPTLDRFMDLNASQNLRGWQESMADLFAWTVGNKILVGERNSQISEIGDLAFAAAVKGFRGKPFQSEWQQTSVE